MMMGNMLDVIHLLNYTELKVHIIASGTTENTP